MNQDLLTKVAVGMVGLALVVAVGVLGYRAIVGGEKPQVLTEEQKMNIMTATLPGTPTTLSERNRGAISETVASSEERAVILSPEDRRALMQVSEQ
jgi:hypothetical protein